MNFPQGINPSILNRSYSITADVEIPDGGAEGVVDAAAMAPSGTVTLFANDQRIGGGRMDHTVPILLTAHAGLEIARDNGEVVDLRYEDKAPFAFTGAWVPAVWAWWSARSPTTSDPPVKPATSSPDPNNLAERRRALNALGAGGRGP
jgi:hypothetical protein